MRSTKALLLAGAAAITLGICTTMAQESPGQRSPTLSGIQPGSAPGGTYRNSMADPATPASPTVQHLNSDATAGANSGGANGGAGDGSGGGGGSGK